MERDHKQKILIVHNYYQIPGGEDTVVANEKRLLEEHGHEVVLYTRHNNELKRMNIIQKLGLPFTTVFNPRTYCEIKKIITEKKIETVHVHNTLNLISPAVYYAAVRMKVPVVQTVHNFRFLCPGATFYRDGHICEDCVSKGLRCAVKHKCYRENKIQTLICVINTWIHRHTGILEKINYIVLTDFNKKKILSLKQITPEKVFVKPNFTYIFDEDENADECDIKRPFFLFVGRIEEIKGIKILLEAWNLMKQKAPRLIVCGSGPLEEWCKDYIRNNNLSMVSMQGRVSNKEVKKLMSKCAALVMPSICYEGFPMTIVEAYSCGCSVIGSDLGNVSSLIEEGVTGCRTAVGDANMLALAVSSFESYDKTAIKDIYLRKYSQLTNYTILHDIYSKLS